MTRNTLIVLLALVNLGGGVVAYYDLTLVSLVVMSMVALVVMIGTLNRIKTTALEKEQLVSSSEKYYLDEEQVKESYLRFYSILNDTVQFVRNVVEVNNPLLTVSVLGSLYLVSLKAYYFGDFIFILMFANLAIVFFFLLGDHREFVKQQSQKTKQQIATMFNNFANTIPRHVKQ